jgi:GAF domain-containing protein/nitrogen-specific signal transduction histidine kinase
MAWPGIIGGFAGDGGIAGRGKKMSASVKPAANPRRTVAEVDKLLRQALAERDEARAQQAATAEILQIINRSSGDATPVFQAIVERAMRLCDAPFGGLLVPDGEYIHYLALGNAPPRFAAFLMQERIRLSTMLGPRVLAGETHHIVDLSKEDSYRRRVPVTVSAVENGGIRTLLTVPLMKEGRLAGAFTLYRSDVRPFTERQIALARSFADQAAIAMENARLLTETREALDRQTATAEVLEVINASPGDLAPVFDTIVDRTLRLCGASLGALCRYDGVMMRLAAEIGASPEAAQALRTVAPEPGSAVRQLVDGAPFVHMADIADDDAYRSGMESRRKFVELTGARTALWLALRKDHALRGMLVVYRREVRPFSDKHVALLQSFADQAVIAIENARLLEEINSRNRDLTQSLERQTATSEILRAIAASPGEAERTLTKIAETTARLFGAAGTSFRIADGDEFKLSVGVGQGAEQVNSQLYNNPARRPTVSGRNLPGAVIRENRQIHIPDLDRLAPEMADWPGLPVARAAGIRVMVGTPLRTGSRAIGALMVYRDELRPLDDVELQLLQSFADQAVIAIENARLLTELRARTADLQQSLKYQTATSDVLKVISRSTFDLQPVLQYVLDTAMRLCHAVQGSIFRVDGTEYRWAVGQGLDPVYEEIERTTRIVPDEGTLVGRAALRRQTVQIEDAWDDPLYAAKDDARITIARSMLGVPLLREGMPIGVIAMARKVVEPFKDKEIELVTTFADQAVIAIENARLLTELRESLEQQRAIAEVLQVINSSPGNLTPVFDAILDKAHSLCGANIGWLLTFDGELVRMQAQRGLGDLDPAVASAAFLPGPAMRRLVEGESFVQIPDISEAKDLPGTPLIWRASCDLLGTGNYLVVPLCKDGIVHGFINAFRSPIRLFSEKEIALLESFAAQAVIAMENARLLGEIKQRQAELRVTFDNMGDAVIMFDGAQRLVAWNRNFLHMLDIPEEWLATPRSYTDFAAYLSARGEFGAAPPPDLGAPDRGEVRPIRYERARPNGRIVEVRRNPIPGGAGFVFIYSDITERKRAEQSILAAREAAEHALADLKLAQANLIQAEKMASLGQLTAGIAHEIKNPLNFVNNFANLSNELLGELKETAAPAFATLDAEKRYEIDETMAMLTGNLEKIQEHGKRADGIVKSMLAHSRGGSGERREADINALVEESLNLAYHGARAQDQNFNVTLERDYDKAMKPIALVPQDITRVFLNLCGNGFYAANKRRKEGVAANYRPMLKVATHDLGDAVEVRIRDNGTGIPPEVRAKLFQPFFTTKPTGEGTGLGLSISYDIVTQQHGGTITVESEVGDFTEFTIRLARKR